MKVPIALLVVFAALLGASQAEGNPNGPLAKSVPADITAVFQKPMYKNSIWGLRVVALDTGRVLLNLKPNYQFVIDSVRKVFSIGELLNQVGAAHRYIHRSIAGANSIERASCTVT
jgi:D-alanyl-D-alanine carboxypeptidase/D-alanyl-D-alanine carboxypeptidase/D-alanyl-D-alanine-endopeptidase (penicillin-binding protein 4)